MQEDDVKRYEPFFGKWRLTGNILGKGAFGKVYEICSLRGEDQGELGALKFLHIPSESALKNQLEQQPDMDAVRSFFEAQLDRVKDEIRILRKCAGHRNIVRYEQHLICENPGRDGIGWDVLIRMERLYPITPFFARADASQLEVVRMWVDIANALICCEAYGIIHRDVKPTNILVSAEGIFKLSDFGAARRNLQGLDASTRIGTEQYMAPEVYKGQKYDRRADCYSLGCVAYFYLNNRRRPFMPPYPQALDVRAMQAADETRILGKRKVPGIPGVSRAVNRILLRSLSYRPQDRYRSARELCRALEVLLRKQKKELGERRLDLSRKPYGENSRGGEDPDAARGRENFAGSGTGTAKPAGWTRAGAVLLAGGAMGLLAVSITGYRGNEEAPEMGTQIRAAEAETEPQPENVIMPGTDLLSEGEEGTGAETWPETETEKCTETEAETEKETAAESATESVTGTELVTEIITEAESEQGTEPGTGAEAGREAEQGEYFLELDRPKDGEHFNGQIGLLGRVFLTGEAEKPSISVRLLENGQLRRSTQIPELIPVSEAVLEACADRLGNQTTVTGGYEFMLQWEVTDLRPGQYTLGVAAQNREGARKAAVEMTLTEDTARMLTGEEAEALHQDAGSSGNAYRDGKPEADGTWRFEDPGNAFALTLGTVQGSSEALPAGQLLAGSAGEEAAVLPTEDGHVIIAGKIFALPGTAAGVLVELDGQTFTLSGIGELGGSADLTLDPAGEGEAPAGEESGESTSEAVWEVTDWKLDMHLPFSGETEHTLGLIFNIAVPGQEPCYADLPAWKLKQAGAQK